MKNLIFVLRIVSSVLVALFGLVFTVLESTLLVTLDFTLYENQFIAFVQLFMRLVLALGAIALGILSIVKNRRSFLIEGICLVVSTVVMIAFVSNNIGIYFTVVSALFLISHLLFIKFVKDKE